MICRVMGFRSFIVMGGLINSIRLSLSIIVLFLTNITYGQHHGFIGYDNSGVGVVPNRYIFIDSAGTLSLGQTFDDGEYGLGLERSGNLAIGWEPDSVENRVTEWYKINGISFEKSPMQLPMSQDIAPIMWIPSTYRALIGSLPIKIWHLDPFSFHATLLSEYNDPLAVGAAAVVTPDLGFMYLQYPDFNPYMVRLHYDNDTGITTGPLTIIPMSHRGSRLLQTTDGRMFVQLSATEYCVIFKVLENGDLQETLNIDMNEVYDVRNIALATISHDERFIFFAARDDVNVSSFDLLSSGTLSPITGWSGFHNAHRINKTPDDKFLIVAHSFRTSQPVAILSVFSISPDGELDYLEDNDIPLQKIPTYIDFFPPPQPIPRPASWRLE